MPSPQSVSVKLKSPAARALTIRAWPSLLAMSGFSSQLEYPRADHQGVAFAFGHVGIFFAARIGFGLGQRRREGEAARLVGGAAREQAAGAAVRDADFGARNEIGRASCREKVCQYV